MPLFAGVDSTTQSSRVMADDAVARAPRNGGVRVRPGPENAYRSRSPRPHERLDQLAFDRPLGVRG